MEHLKLVRFSHPLLIIGVRKLEFTRFLAFFICKNKTTYEQILMYYVNIEKDRLGLKNEVLKL